MEILNVNEIFIEESRTKPGNFYFNHGDKIVSLNKKIIASIESGKVAQVKIDLKKFEKQTNPETGKLEDKPWERLQVVGVVPSKRAALMEKTADLKAVIDYKKLEKTAATELELKPAEMDALVKEFVG